MTTALNVQESNRYDNQNNTNTLINEPDTIMEIEGQAEGDKREFNSIHEIGNGLDAPGNIPIIGMKSSVEDSSVEVASKAPESNVRNSMIFGKR